MSRHLVTFVGDAENPGTNPEAAEAFGLVFPVGKAVPIDATSDNGKRIISKLKGNRHFAVTDEAETVLPEPPKPRRGRPPRTAAPVFEPVNDDENHE